MLLRMKAERSPWPQHLFMRSIFDHYLKRSPELRSRHSPKRIREDKLKPAALVSVGADANGNVYRKVIWRILPFLFICNTLAWIDRVNISFAHLQFQQDLGLSDAAYGIGVGLFFVGYIPCEVPSNLLLQRFGARKTISRILILWGLISVCTMFVRTPWQFYGARFLLGAAEAGFTPGMVLYLTYWFPGERRARVVSILFTATAVSGIIGGPVSGWIMTRLHDGLGLHGWQWLFLVEGIPAVLMGVVAIFFLDDGPSNAKWLSPAEKAALQLPLAGEEKDKKGANSHSFIGALKDKRLYALALGYMAIPWGGSVVNYWAPAIIRRSGVSDIATIGLLSSVPFIIGAVAMLVISRRSDRRLERRWHFASMALLTACGIALLPNVGSDWLPSLVLLTVATAGYLGSFAVFWTIPQAYLAQPAAAGGIAFISSVGQLGGLTAPMIIGWADKLTGSYDSGLYLVSAVVVAAAIALLVGIPANVLHERRSRPSRAPGNLVTTIDAEVVAAPNP